jgi:hypothetical protein
VTSQHGNRTVHVSLRGSLPGNDIQVQLPVFADAGVRSVIGGTYNVATHTVTMHGPVASIVLGQSAKPTVGVQTASTLTGTHR